MSDDKTEEKVRNQPSVSPPFHAEKIEETITQSREVLTRNLAWSNAGAIVVISSVTNFQPDRLPWTIPLTLFIFGVLLAVLAMSNAFTGLVLFRPIIFLKLSPTPAGGIPDEVLLDSAKKVVDADNEFRTHDKRLTYSLYCLVTGTMASLIAIWWTYLTLVFEFIFTLLFG